MFKFFKRDKPPKKKIKRIVYKKDYLKYKGEVNEDGNPDGIGKLYRLDLYDKPIVYEGEFKDGMINGKGTYIDKTGTYTGVFEKNNFKSGSHICTGLYQTKQYVGKFENFKIIEGNLYIDGILDYTGTFENEKRHGKGTIFHKNGKKKYCGDFNFGNISGFGEYYDNNELLIYTGDVFNNYYHGNGTMFYEDGKSVRLTGQFSYSNLDGIVNFYDRNGNIECRTIYKRGEIVSKAENIVNGELYGNGVLYYKNGQIRYEGSFNASKYHGYGKIYRLDGTLECYGYFENGKLNGYTELFDSTGIMETSGHCKNNIKIGVWKVYSDTGIQKKYYENIPQENIIQPMNDYDDDLPINNIFDNYFKRYENKDDIIKNELLHMIKNVTHETQIESIKEIETKCSKLKTLNFGKDHLTNPLFMVCYHKTYNKYLIELFVRLGVDLNYKSSHGSTALMYLAQGGKLDMLRYLMHKGADYKLVDQRGWGLYHYARESNNEETIQFVSNIKEVPKKTIQRTIVHNGIEMEEVNCSCFACQDTIFICPIDHKN